MEKSENQPSQGPTISNFFTNILSNDNNTTPSQSLSHQAFPPNVNNEEQPSLQSQNFY